MRTIEIRKISITELDTDAIVNAANSALLAGGGVCGAVFRAAGHKQLQEACDRIGHCPTGSAVITPGFGLKAKYIIHAVGPRWVDGRHGEPQQLSSAYQKALALAAEHGCRSVGFPLISAGIFGYPVALAWERAIAACRGFLAAHPETALDVVFAVLDDSVMEAGLAQLESVE
ncbi:MAG: macro domain-containing protein [Clostridia bacterium]|nr:macro domain-containing protein [Clostridia bacterium]MBQ4364884.1 macro domain-containing protein [Clostridia bacterium]